MYAQAHTHTHTHTTVYNRDGVFHSHSPGQRWCSEEICRHSPPDALGHSTPSTHTKETSITVLHYKSLYFLLRTLCREQWDKLYRIVGYFQWCKFSHKMEIWLRKKIFEIFVTHVHMCTCHTSHGSHVHPLTCAPLERLCCLRANSVTVYGGLCIFQHWGHAIKPPFTHT